MHSVFQLEMFALTHFFFLLHHLLGRLGRLFSIPKTAHLRKSQTNDDHESACLRVGGIVLGVSSTQWKSDRCLRLINIISLKPVSHAPLWGGSDCIGGDRASVRLPVLTE